MIGQSVNMETFTVSEKFQASEVLESLRKWGAAVIPGLIIEEPLENLCAEFEGIFSDNSEYIQEIDYKPGLARGIIRTSKFQERWRHINNFFSSIEMQEVARQYVGYPCLLNREIYATHEYIPGTDVAPTHFDKLWTLKFMLYLNDVNAGSAPFGVVPGSHIKSRAIFRDIYEENHIDELSMSSELYQQMKNANPALDDAVVNIVGSAGTLIIFDTDTYHHAPPVTDGHERKILRGHTGPYTKYINVKKFSRQWWRGERAYSKIDYYKDRLLGRT